MIFCIIPCIISRKIGDQQESVKIISTQSLITLTDVRITHIVTRWMKIIMLPVISGHCFFLIPAWLCLFKVVNSNLENINKLPFLNLTVGMEREKIQLGKEQFKSGSIPQMG